MTRRELAELICKTIALTLFGMAGYYFVVTFLYGLFQILSFSWSLPNIFTVLVINAPLFGFIAVGWCYWVKAEFIAQKMIVDDNPDAIVSRIYIHDIMVVVFSATGLWFFLTTIKDGLPLLMQIGSHEVPNSELFRSGAFLALGIRVATSIWLLLGSRGIVKGIDYLRERLIQFESDPIDTICRSCGERHMKEMSHCPLCGTENKGHLAEEKTERPL